MSHLEQEGFEVRTLNMGSGVVQRVKQLCPALVIIEASMSKGPALDLCRLIRRLHSLARTPVVLLSSNASEEERILGLESGADDYLTQSSSGREVVARIRAAMRCFTRLDLTFGKRGIPHSSPQQVSSEAVSSAARIGDIEINPAAMTIAVRGRPVTTTTLEFRLLWYLFHNEKRVFTRDQLLDAVWGAEFVELRSVDACIRRLRRKIEPQPLRPTYLKTIRGAGYCLHASMPGPPPPPTVWAHPSSQAWD